MKYKLHKLPEGVFIFEEYIHSCGTYIDLLIAQQDQIDFSALTENEQKKIGRFDVVDLKLKEFKKIDDGYTSYYDFTIGFNKGFQKAQELLSDRVFTDIDMINAYQRGINDGYNLETESYNDDITDLNEKEYKRQFIQSLYQPKSWGIEGEFVGGKFKITKIL